MEHATREKHIFCLRGKGYWILTWTHEAIASGEECVNASLERSLDGARFHNFNTSQDFRSGAISMINNIIVHSDTECDTVRSRVKRIESLHRQSPRRSKWFRDMGAGAGMNEGVQASLLYPSRALTVPWDGSSCAVMWPSVTDVWWTYGNTSR